MKDPASFTLEADGSRLHLRAVCFPQAFEISKLREKVGAVEHRFRRLQVLIGRCSAGLPEGSDFRAVCCQVIEQQFSEMGAGGLALTHPLVHKMNISSRPQADRSLSRNFECEAYAALRQWGCTNACFQDVESFMALVKAAGAFFNGSGTGIREVFVGTVDHGTRRGVTFPPAYDLRSLFEKLLMDINACSLGSSVLRALFLKIGILALHPLPDANRRLSNVLSNLALGLPAGVYLPLGSADLLHPSAHLLIMRQALYFQDWFAYIRYSLNSADAAIASVNRLLSGSTEGFR